MTDSSRVGLVLAASFAAAAISSAYLPLWFADRGLSASEIGLVLGVSSLLRVVGAPGGGWAADVFGRRLVLSIAAAVAAAATVSLPGLSGVGPLLAATALLGLAASLLSPLIDAATLALAAAGRLEYAPTRAWGSVSYMLATATAGAVLARTGTVVVPWVLAAGFALAAAGSLFLPDVTRVAARASGSIAGVFRNRAFVLSLIATALIQGSHAAYYSFAPLHWRAAGLTDTAIGLLIAEGIVAEIALFLWGRRLVTRLGAARLTSLAASACIVRWTALAFVTDWRALAMLQFLHAATFAFQHLATMMVLARLPPGCAGMAQTVMSAIGFSAATGVLVWVTGQAYAGWGGLAFLPMALAGGAALFTVRPLRRVLARQVNMS